MISVQNHLQQLSGNKKWYLFLFVGLLMSCAGPKETLLKSKNSKKNSDEAIEHSNSSEKLKLDTIHWIVESEDVFPPIKNEDLFRPGIFLKDVYNISLFIPFGANRILLDSSTSATDLVQNRFINYYGGVILALKELEKENVNLNVTVFDTERRVDNFRNHLHSFENRSADLIIGPYDRNSLREAANFGKKEKIPVVSPWQASDRITSENPYYIQLRPNLDSHYEKLVDHALSEFERDQLILVSSENSNDKARIRSIQNSISKGMDDVLLPPLEELFINKEDLLLPDSLFTEFFTREKPLVFIIPNWSSNDEDFIYGSLRKLNAEKGEHEVYVYGMPILLESDKISFDLYRSLNIRICISQFVDNSNSSVNEFENLYYREYRALPTKDALEGYDSMLFLGRALQKYGTSFQYYLDMFSTENLQTNFNVTRKYLDESKDEIEYSKEIKYFENVHLYIVKYLNNQFFRSTN